MPANPPKGTPRVSPYLYYEDVAAALTWLSSAFGFKERMRMPGPDGSVMHAEMEIEDGLVMLGCPSTDYQNPKRLGHVTQGLYIFVDDVDKHFQKAKESGAEIVNEPEDQFYGDRRYTALDPEGHQWFFATHVRDVDKPTNDPLLLGPVRDSHTALAQPGRISPGGPPPSKPRHQRNFFWDGFGNPMAKVHCQSGVAAPGSGLLRKSGMWRAVCFAMGSKRP